MKVTIEMTPEEAKEMMLPSDKAMEYINPQFSDFAENIFDMQKEFMQQIQDNFKMDNEKK